MRLKRNKRKHSPIRGLANYMRWFNQAKPKKAELAELRAAMADRIYEASFPRKERL